jgi:hypothetical protein
MEDSPSGVPRGGATCAPQNPTGLSRAVNLMAASCHHALPWHKAKGGGLARLGELCITHISRASTRAVLGGALAWLSHYRIRGLEILWADVAVAA